MSQERAGVRRIARDTGIITLLTLLLFVLLEGVSSTAIFLEDFVWPARVEGGVWEHTRPDEDLGWVNQPNRTIPDFYGPGRHFRTNAQGFRNDSEFTAEEPEGRVRLICSGDSFTLGYGVSNADTWCAQLSALDPRLETVNMGQAGYGLGQAYLWYRRDGARLEHTVHVLAFITADIARMRRDDYQGNRQPRLDIEDGVLVVRNVPVHRRGFFPLSRQRVAAIQDLRIVRVASVPLRRLGWSAAGRSRQPPETVLAAADLLDPESQAIVDALLDALVDEDRKAGRVLVLLHLPVRADYRSQHVMTTEYGYESSSAWRRHLADQAATSGFVFIDMIENFDSLAADDHQRMYLLRSLVGLRAGHGHLSELGNRRVAQVVYDRLRGVSVLDDRLTPAHP